MEVWRLLEDLTRSKDDSVDFAALLDRAADPFSVCMDTKVDSNDGPSGETS